MICGASRVYPPLAGKPVAFCGRGNNDDLSFEYLSLTQISDYYFSVYPISQGPGIHLPIIASATL